VILVDTSVWVEHLRSGHPTLAALLEGGGVLCHPAVIGEIALGHLVNRAEVLGLLAGLPGAEVATSDEVLAVINDHHLHGRGIGYVDVQLLASTLLTPDATLWSLDKRLVLAASTVGRRSDPTDRADLLAAGPDA
jgi:predicted nucleic acid-binding protein